MITAPRGTVDITPEKIREWHYTECEIRRIMELFQYNEIRTPIFENTELFLRGVGEGTDIVTKEMYTFNDKGGRSITLRPEGTASVVRSYIENNYFGINKLTKFYYIGPMFRYERPQAGRLRQHHQFGVEAIGAASPDVDVEVIALAMHLYGSLGLKNLNMRLNSVGCADCRQEYLKQLKAFFEDKRDQLCSDCNVRLDKNPLRVLDCKNPSCGEQLKSAPDITDYVCVGCREHFENVIDGLKKLDINYVLDKKLVRGLDYYTRTTFEVVASGIGAQDSIAGGGRYDNLVKSLGGPDTPAVGFGSGIERLIATLKKFEIDLPMKARETVFFAFLDNKSRKIGLPVLYECRKLGISCETDYFDRSLKAQLKLADKLNARYVIIIGEDEIAKNSALIRDFKTKEQSGVEISKISEYIQKNLM